MENYDVPFYSNTPDDTHCFQAALKMVLKFFLPDRDFSWEELDRITAKVDGLWTWPTSGLIWLNDKGFNVKNIETFNYKKFIQQGSQYLIDLYGNDVGGAQIKHSDIKQEIGLAGEFVEKIESEVRIPSSSEIVEFVQNGYLVICNINSKVLNKEEGYSGHFVLIKGTSDSGFTINDPGLPALENRTINFEEFERAWAYPNELAKNIIAIRYSSKLF